MMTSPIDGQLNHIRKRGFRTEPDIPPKIFFAIELAQLFHCPYFGGRNKGRLRESCLLVGFGVGGMLRDGQDEIYRAHAAKCIQVAQNTADSEAKLALLEMARAWRALANQHDKNSQTTLVYEAPEPRKSG